jgi:hypothetical protein
VTLSSGPGTLSLAPAIVVRLLLLVALLTLPYRLAPVPALKVPSEDLLDNACPAYLPRIATQRSEPAGANTPPTTISMQRLNPVVVYTHSVRSGLCLCYHHCCGLMRLTCLSQGL